MTSKNTLSIGTRGSALALAQADMVRAALSLRYPELDVRCEIIHTIGDRRTDVPLADVARVSGMVDKGIFIKELETALRDGRIDVEMCIRDRLYSARNTEHNEAAALRDYLLQRFAS